MQPLAGQWGCARYPCPALLASAAACPCHFAKRQGFNFPFFFFPFLILCSIPALPQHRWVPASTRSRSLLSSSPGGFAGCSHLLTALGVPSEGSGRGTSLPTHIPLHWGGFTVSVLLSLGACKDLKIHPACGDTPGTPCPSELGTAGVEGAGAGSGPPWPPLLHLTDGKVSCARL